MVSAAEQLAANLNFSAFAKAEELKKRIWFTLGALLVYRLGTYIPLPGIDPSAWEQIFRTQAGGILGMFNMFAGGGINRMAIFALNIMPYISASIIIQLMTTVSPTLEALKKEGEAGRKTINQYTRYLTVLLAAFQAYAIAAGLEGAGNAVTEPGMFFRISTVITLTGGTMFLMWLGEQITSRGIGNGISLIILAGIVAELPSAIAGTLELGRQGALSTGLILIVLVMAVVVIAFIVFMERAQRRLLIQYPKRQVGNRMFEGQSSHLPLKLNTSGVIPPIFASSLLLLPTTVANFNAGQGPDWLSTITTQLSHGRPLFLVLADRVLRVLLYRDRVQPDRDRRQSQEAWRLHSRHPSGRAYCRIYRLRALAHHGDRRGLSFDRLPHSRNPDLLCGGAVLFRRHLAADRGQRHHGYGGAGAGLSARAPV
jgi:preprotein translocase subunit SecY